MQGDYMEDHRGRLVPADIVSEYDKTRDQLVRDLVKKARAVAAEVADFKLTAMDEIQAFVELSCERYGVTLGGQKGNVTLATFDGRYKILRAISDRITFDERLQAAKRLIDECIIEWSSGARQEVVVLVNQAFEVDKQGKINTNRILGLRRLNINDAKWRRAMDAIHDSIMIDGTREYIRVYERDNDGKYRQLPLDISAA